MLFGLRITDWGTLVTSVVALAAFVVSLWFGFFAALVADSWAPTIEIEPPTTLAIRCYFYDKTTRKCDDDSTLRLSTGTFSFWNSSKSSTKKEIVQEVTAAIMLQGDVSSHLLRWKYFKNRTDEANNYKRNAARFILSRGDIRNYEIDFLLPEALKWKMVEEAIYNEGKVTVIFFVDLLHIPDRTIECTMNLGKLERQLPHNYVIDEQVVCANVQAKQSKELSAVSWSRENGRHVRVYSSP